MRNSDRAARGELRYSVSDILRFETEVRAQRKEVQRNTGYPIFHRKFSVASAAISTNVKAAGW